MGSAASRQVRSSRQGSYQEILEAAVASPTVEPTIDRVAADLAPAGIPKQEVWQAMNRFLTEAEAAERIGRPWRELVRGKFTLPEPDQFSFPRSLRMIFLKLSAYSSTT
ncbi:hypothetical protein ACVIIV_006889 [Bradyrhizobium sp. USDA 4354]